MATLIFNEMKRVNSIKLFPNTFQLSSIGYPYDVEECIARLIVGCASRNDVSLLQIGAYRLCKQRLCINVKINVYTYARGYECVLLYLCLYLYLSIPISTIPLWKSEEIQNNP